MFGGSLAKLWLRQTFVVSIESVQVVIANESLLIQYDGHVSMRLNTIVRGFIRWHLVSADGTHC
jgi:hypothetical protein